MANGKIDTSSFESQKPEEKDEVCENIPPTSVLGETCSTTPNLNVKGKTRLSGLQFALTPILKYLNIGNKSASSNSNSSPIANSVPVLPVGDDKESYACSVLNEKLPEISVLDATCNSPMNTSNTQFNSTTNSPLFTKERKNPLRVLDVNLNSKLCPTGSSFQWLSDEILPEVTLLDDTCDTTVNLTRPDHGSMLLNSDTPLCKADEPENTDENQDLDDKPNLTFSPEECPLAAERETIKSTHDCTTEKSPLELSETVSKHSQSSQNNSETSFNGNLTHSVSSGSAVFDSTVEDTKKVKLQVTQDIFLSCTLDGSNSSSENGGQTMNKTHPVAKVQAINVTCDLSSSNESVQSGMSRSSGCISSNVTYELEGEPVKTSAEKPSSSSDSTTGDTQGTAVSLNGTFTTTQDKNAIPNRSLQNQTMDFSTSNSDPPMPEIQNSQVSTKQISPQSSLVLNNSSSDTKSSQSCEMQNQTFDQDSPKKSSQCSTIVVQSSNKTMSLQTTFESKPPGVVMDISNLSSNPAMPDKENTNVSSKEITQESSPVLNDNCSDSNSSKNCKTLHQTFDKESHQSSSGSTMIGKSNATSTSFQETFESKSNGTITHKETSTTGEKSQGTTNAPSPSPVENVTDPSLPEISHEKVEGTVSDDKPAEPQKCTLIVNVAAEEPTGPSGGEINILLNNGQALVDHKADVRRASTFSLDSTLDFNSDRMITSTPMSTNKAFNFSVEREKGKTSTVQKTLYGDGPIKSIARGSSEIPSNIVCNRKTFLRQPATKTQLHSIKPPTLLSKFKPGTLLPKLPKTMTRQMEELKTNTAQATGMPIYNLRSTAAASALKPPLSVLQKPTSSGLQRAGQGLKPPLAKGISGASSASDKPAGGTQPLVKTTATTKKHHLPKTDALPEAKKKKMDNPLPSRKADASGPSSDVTAKVLKAPSCNQKTQPAKSLKEDSSASADNTAAHQSSCKVGMLRPPAPGLKVPTAKPQCTECANCVSLEAQLKRAEMKMKDKDEEIRLLKEELLKVTRS